MYFLPRRVGLANAKELIFTGRKVDADEALALGIVDRMTVAGRAARRCPGLGRRARPRAPAAALALAKTILDQTLRAAASSRCSRRAARRRRICYTTARAPARRSRPSCEDVEAMKRANDAWMPSPASCEPRSVAVIGASADPTKTAGRPVAYLQKHGFAGAIYPVNPRVDAHRRAALLSRRGVAARGARRRHRAARRRSAREQAVRDLAARGTAAAIVLASGYAETGEDGARRQQALREAAGAMRLLGPNTIGLVNLTDSIVLSATGALEMDDFRPAASRVVSQSGGILGSLLSRAAARGIGFSKLVSTSNEVDLELADFIDHLADDDATAVIALYIETVRNPRAFRARGAERGRRAASRRGRFKVGRSEAGAAGRRLAHRRAGRRGPDVRRAVPPASA